MRHALLAVALVAAPARADIVCDWMAYADGVAASIPLMPGTARSPDTERASTQTALAMFEATNAIDRRFESYLGLPKGDPKASQKAAAVTAAYRVLIEKYPAQKAGIEDNYRIAMEAISDEASREAGRAIGEAAAKLALAAGGIDPSVVQTHYRPRTMPGVYIATALPVFEPFSTAFRPWVLPRVDALRPASPPALTSERWARDFNEVKEMGGRTSATRTLHQTLMARYRITPDMMPSLRLVAETPGRSLVQNARMFALVGMASDDSYMATIEAKLHYNFWRPITAIRNAEEDGNTATAADSGWMPLIATPNHPEYPCGHCTYAASVAEIMKAETGLAPVGGVRVASRSIPGAAVQVLPSWDEWVREVSYSRILGGVHYRFANEAGEGVGRAVAKMTLAKVMRPLPR